jgi:hypothetical protein
MTYRYNNRTKCEITWQAEIENFGITFLRIKNEEIIN